jgi:hypothetical protein
VNGNSLDSRFSSSLLSPFQRWKLTILFLFYFSILIFPDSKSGASAILETSNQHLKDLRIAVEFKSLTSQAPGGVYLVPHLDDIRQLYGVIFVRRGLYKNGIFRFKMTLPPTYNSLGSTPQITFTPPIFNPLVDAKVFSYPTSPFLHLTPSDRCLKLSQWRRITWMESKETYFEFSFGVFEKDFLS